MPTEKEKLSWTLHAALPVGAEDGVRSLTAEDIGVVFQPIVSIANGKLMAHEALVRCKRPEYKNPTRLFEHAVTEAACGGLGRLIRDVAFATAGDVPLFVNLHPEELASRWLVRTDDPIGFHSKQVYLEITETAALSHRDLCMGVVKELCRRTHALLVVDDFGAGYSNLERVVELEPAIVKLDLALVRGVHRHKRRQIVIRHVVNLCSELGAGVVAEGVETLDELKCVRDLGVGFAQGYLIAKPSAPPPVPYWPLSPATTASRYSISAPPRATLHTGKTPGTRSKPPIATRNSKPPIAIRNSKPPPPRNSKLPPARVPRPSKPVPRG